MISAPHHARPPCPRIALNAVGRDFVAGDVHGHFPALERALDAVGFRAGVDRLFCVGDLVDRGPDSPAALEWLERGAFDALVRGNHEEILLEALARRLGLLPEPGYSAEFRHRAGGAWADAVLADAALCERWYAALSRLPFALTVETAGGPVGIVHASPCPGAWAETLRRCADPADDEALEVAVWGRVWSADDPFCLVDGDDVACVVVGHLPVPVPTRTGRVVNVDTGAGTDLPGARVTVLALADALALRPVSAPAPFVEVDAAPAPASVSWLARPARWWRA